VGNEQVMRTVPLGRLFALAATVVIVAAAVAVVTAQYRTTTLVGHLGVVGKVPSILVGSRTTYQIALPAALAGLFLLYAGYAFVVVRRTGRQATEQAEVRELPRQEDESTRRAA
jgi:uncharacterized BrkB/YihY/UPF0761 family membrane protein